MRRQARLAALLYGCAVAVYGVDRLTKFVVERHLAGRPPIEVIPGVVRLRYTTNPGGAFGLFGGQPWLFFAATVLVSLVIVAFSRKLDTRISAVGLGLIMGGALGNLTDRILRGPGVSGQVVDFIDFRVWPVFNAADSAIVIGALVLALATFRRRA